MNRKPQKPRKAWLTAGLLGLVAGLVLGIVAVSSFGPHDSGPQVAPAEASAEAVAAETPVAADATTPMPSLAPMLDRVLPAIVNLSTEQEVVVQRSPLFDDPFFRRFFNVPDRPQKQTRHSLGSGVIVDADKGYIVTNHHVVAGADAIEVTLRDGTTHEAKLVGSDPEVDLAIVQIDAEGLTQVEIADSDRLRVGDYVVAIGNPFGLGQTVTSGIVSALGRTGLGIEGYENFIQTDASINPGNSGGALVNLRGELVGINTAIVGPAGGNVGIGFAIPTNMAQGVMDQLIEFGEVKRGQLGIYIQDLDPDLARALGLDEQTKGVLVSEVIEDSAADEAGLKKGDVILAVDGQKVTSGAELRNIVGLSPVGREIEIELLRDGKEKTLSARIRQRSAERSEAEEIDSRLEGATLGSIERSHPLFGRVEGVQVLAIEPGSPAEQAGLRAGDVITEVNRRDVHDLAEFRRAVRDGGDRLLLHVRRGDGAFYLVIE